MKTLYVSDLDGTLLNSDARLTEFTKHTINRLIDSGMMFTYATARSYITAHKVTEGLNINIPVVLNNGAFIADCKDGGFITKNLFDDSVHSLLDDLLENNIYPMVFSYFGSEEKMTFVTDNATEGMKLFLDSRQGDPRTNPTKDSQFLHTGDIYCIVCMDETEKLQPFMDKYKDSFHCTLDTDVYTKTPWLVINPRSTSKSNAIHQLKKMLNCDRVVVFGDGMNDVDMFIRRDESYAVENAHRQLKSVATKVVLKNTDNGVAKWLAENYI